MFASLLQGTGRMLAVLTIPLFVGTAHAQWGGFGGPCAPCGQSVAMAPPQYAAAPVGYNPCAQTVSVAAACPCMQPVTETVYREVPVTQYKPVTKTVQRPVTKTVYVDQEVTAYRQVMEQRTAEVPTVQYQTVQECRPVTVNRSYWQTVYQPVAKGSPCQYDNRPGLLGWANRTSYDLRMAFTPNYLRQRQFVPNVQTVNVPQSRVVSIPGTRQVTYNVAKMEPYTTTVKVARTIVEQEDVQVTVMEPYTVTKTVAVGNQTRWAYVDPFGGSTATALQPTPDRRSAEQTVPKKTTSTGNIQQNSYQQPQEPSYPQLNHVPATPAASPALFDANPEPQPAPAAPGLFFEQGSRGSRTTASTSAVAGWRASRRSSITVAKPETKGPQLPAVAAN